MSNENCVKTRWSERRGPAATGLRLVLLIKMSHNKFTLFLFNFDYFRGFVISNIERRNGITNVFPSLPNPNVLSPALPQTTSLYINCFPLDKSSEWQIWYTEWYIIDASGFELISTVRTENFN